MKPISIVASPRSRTAIGIGASLLIHALILFFALAHSPVPIEEPAGTVNALSVRLIPAPPEATVAATMTQLAPPPSKTSHAKVAPRPKKAIAQKKTEATKPIKIARSQPLPPVQKPLNTALPTDMMAMVNAARDRRRAEGAPEPEESSDDAKPDDDNAIARANVAHSMQQSRGHNDSGGVFQITFKGVRTAEFVFRGWDVRRRADSHQLIEVDAGLNGNIETAIIQKMIDLIRRTQPGDFNWESYRLGRVVVLSARVQDNAELQTFLKHEFFDSYR